MSGIPAASQPNARLKRNNTNNQKKKNQPQLHKQGFRLTGKEVILIFLFNKHFDLIKVFLFDKHFDYLLTEVHFRVRADNYHSRQSDQIQTIYCLKIITEL